MSVSTGIHGHLTFGTGKLDAHGFWEHPDYASARQWEKDHPQDGPCWPHTEEQLKEMGIQS